MFGWIIGVFIFFWFVGLGLNQTRNRGWLSSDRHQEIKVFCRIIFLVVIGTQTYLSFFAQDWIALAIGLVILTISLVIYLAQFIGLLDEPPVGLGEETRPTTIP